MDFFAYGTLMCCDIMYRVTGCRPPKVPATLADYHRYSIKNEVYPGIVEERGSRVRGIMYCELPEQVVALLDRFEGEMYTRSTVRVFCYKGKSMSAFTYVIRPEFASCLTSSDWSYAEFLKSAKKKFTADCFGSQAGMDKR